MQEMPRQRGHQIGCLAEAPLPHQQFERFAVTAPLQKMPQLRIDRGR